MASLPPPTQGSITRYSVTTRPSSAELMAFRTFRTRFVKLTASQPFTVHGEVTSKLHVHCASRWGTEWMPDPPAATLGYGVRSPRKPRKQQTKHQKKPKLIKASWACNSVPSPNVPSYRPCPGAATCCHWRNASRRCALKCTCDSLKSKPPASWTRFFRSAMGDRRIRGSPHLLGRRASNQEQSDALQLPGNKQLCQL